MLWKAALYVTNASRQTFSKARADAALYLAILTYAIAGLLLLRIVGRSDLAAHRLYLEQWTMMFLFLMPTIALLLDAIYIMHRFNTRRSLAFRRAFSPHRISCLVSGAALLMALMLFQGTFTSIKNVLPILRGGFPYDRIQADIDAALHFGVDPWRILYAVGGSDFVRRAIEWNYNVFWFLACFAGLFFVVTSPRTCGIRARYVVMFMLVWVVCGNLLAGLFLSAGPVFYGAVTGDDIRFAGVIDFLARSNGLFSSAQGVQNYLWELHSSGRARFGSGISAFPSVHVGLIAMNAFFVMDRSRRLGLVALCYVGLVTASSVYLGWHYAIDGYVSIAVVAALHVACKRLMRRSAASAPEEEVDQVLRRTASQAEGRPLDAPEESWLLQPDAPARHGTGTGGSSAVAAGL